MQNKLEDIFEGRQINAVVIGASGGIGSAFVDLLTKQHNVQKVYALSRSGKTFNDAKVETHTIDITDEESVRQASEQCGEQVDIVIVASGELGGGTKLPEKSLRDINMDDMLHSFKVNTFGPALVTKYFVPLLPRKGRSIFAALSARVGSISDNKLGGWYSYRAAKAGLNMIIRNVAIEAGRRYKDAVILALHPGAVDTDMTRPYHANIQYEIFSPEKAAAQLLDVVLGCSPSDSGKFMQWDGQEIAP